MEKGDPARKDKGARAKAELTDVDPAQGVGLGAGLDQVP